MSNVVKIAVPAVKLGYEFAKKNWRAIAAAFAFISKFVVDHPEIPSWFRSQISRIRKRLLIQILKPTLEAQISGIVDVVRDEARAVVDGFDSKSWIERADGVDRELRLAKLQDRDTRRKTLVAIKEKADELVADLIQALASTAAPGSSKRNL